MWITRQNLILFFIILSSGCATYKFDGKTYHSAEALYVAQQRLNQHEISRIPSYVNPKFKSAKFYLPSRYDFVEKGTETTNLGSKIDKNIGISKAVSFEFMYEALKKRNLFETLHLERSNQRSADLGEYDAIILYYIVDEKTVRSRIFTKKAIGLPLVVNTKLSSVFERTINWLTTVENIMGTELLLPTASSELFVPRFPANIDDANFKYPTLSATPSVPKTSNTFSIKYTCDDLSKSDAYKLLAKGHDYLDRDGDGHPCEWGKRNYKKTKYKSRKSSSRNCNWVKGYMRKNGTYVRGHRRCK